MKIKNIILLFVLLIFFSCSNPSEISQKSNPKVKTDSIANEPTLVKLHDTIKWNQYNDKLFIKYRTKIELSDIELALDCIKKKKLLEKGIKINNSSFSSFCYLSPSAMLDNLIQGNKLSWPDSMKVITNDDKKFILTQEMLKGSKYFKWQYLTNKLDTTRQFPQYKISLPVFSLDKKKFIICIEKYTAGNCLTKGISYLFVINGKTTKHFRFDEISDCPH